MTPASVRMLVLDLDGTVLAPDLTVSERVVGAVRSTMERGIPVVLATGRMYRSALPFAALLGLSAPLICYQGAYVRELPRDGADGEVLLHDGMGERLTQDAIRWARAHGFDPHVCVDDRLLMQRGDETAADYERLAGVTASFVPELLDAVPEGATKVLAVGPADLPLRRLAEARDAFEGRAQVTVSHPEYIEWTRRGVHKGRAVRWLARREEIPLRNVVAIGDQFNDLEMLAAVGYGVAMATAPPEVRASARYVTADIHDDGAALAIEALVLGSGSLD